jgi:hypothetical protein
VFRAGEVLVSGAEVAVLLRVAVLCCGLVCHAR